MQPAKKCPNCGVVENYEAGPLTVCQNCGEVLAESWALGDAVTDIMDNGRWLDSLRTEAIVFSPVMPSLGAIARGATELHIHDEPPESAPPPPRPPRHRDPTPDARPITADLPQALVADNAPLVMMVAMTSPGVAHALQDLIKGTAAKVVREAIDKLPILVVHGLDRAELRSLADRLERVGIPSKTQAADPQPGDEAEGAENAGIAETPPSARPRSWKRKALAIAIALAIGGAIVFWTR